MIDETLLDQMTLEEKVSLCHAQDTFSVAGIPRLEIEPLVMTDGPNGIREEQQKDLIIGLGREEDRCTYFPAETVLAATWNLDLARHQGEAHASEARYRGKDVLLAPGINVIRTPVGGRNFEYFSEDPYLISKLAVAVISGIQSKDVAACVKHYVLNNQETNRGAVNIEVSKRALFEIYLKGFEASVKEADVYCVMGAYNCYNGQHCCHNAYLVNDILKGRWNYQGVYVSDWAGTHDTLEAICNGLDIEMGTVNGDHCNDYLADSFLALLKEQPKLEEYLNDKVRRSLRLHHKLHKGMHDREKGSFNTPEHQGLTYEIAAEGIVLLKNENLLPISKSVSRILVTGPNADREQADGGGSSMIAAYYEITPLEGIRSRFKDCEIQYIAEADEEMLKAYAGEADLVVYCGGLSHDLGFDCEDADKKDMKLPGNQDAEITALLSANPNTVIVMISGSPVEMPWANEARAIIWAGYAGMEAGNALADILTGKVNPSGKLTYTIPHRLEDSPAVRYGGYSFENNVYKDDIFVGYRGYDRDHIEPQFCFGHGLHYGDVEYQEIACHKVENTLEVSVQLKNTGENPVKETVQIYAAYPAEIADRPPQELKAFVKESLEPGEIRRVVLTIPMNQLAIYSEEKDEFVFIPGTYGVYVGASSRDIRLRQFIEL